MDIKTIAYNAIDYMICEAGMTIEEICDYLCCTEEELREKGLIQENE